MLKAQIKSIPKSILIICLLILLFSILIVIAWKPLRVLNLQSRGGEKIEDYIQSYAPEFENYFTCQLPALTTLPDDDELAKAVALLEKAKMLSPENAQTYLLLGRVYCLQKDYVAAIEALEGYSRQRPGNPLGDLERAFAHFTIPFTGKDMSETDKNTHLIQSRLIFEKKGYSGAYFLAEGNSAFNRWINPDYRAAWYLYKLSGIFQPLPEEFNFRMQMMDVAFQNNTELPRNIEEDVFLIDGTQIIPPSAFLRLADGAFVGTKEIEGKIVGRYFSNNDTGITFIEVPNKAHFCFTVEALDRPPEPIMIEFSLDLESLLEIKLSFGDDEWRSHKTDVILDEGIHLLGLRLMNDGNFNGVDRNAHLGEVIIQPCQ